ncbi:unnamed protein product [Nesidiocoris tenuis]|uniref:Uncharacterized protein n=1 Tax=Nesidiocoris tenuis TaxID=355587 RepID=A0A6H5HCJ8_9HEMI|nr:unnamed protein product [Nesidiocoris tenuis]
MEKLIKNRCKLGAGELRVGGEARKQLKRVDYKKQTLGGQGVKYGSRAVTIKKEISRDAKRRGAEEDPHSDVGVIYLSNAGGVICSERSYPYVPWWRRIVNSSCYLTIILKLKSEVTVGKLLNFPIDKPSSRSAHWIRRQLLPECAFDFVSKSKLFQKVLGSSGLPYGGGIRFSIFEDSGRHGPRVVVDPGNWSFRMLEKQIEDPSRRGNVQCDNRKIGKCRGPGGGSAPLGALPAAAPGTKSPPPTGAGSGGQSSAGNGAALPANFEASLCRLISYCARSRHLMPRVWNFRFITQ